MSDSSFKAKNCFNQIGIVLEKNIVFYPGINRMEWFFFWLKINLNFNFEILTLRADELELAKSVYQYDGISDEELSFPSEIYIRILRKDSKRKVDSEEWWEGVYEDTIGYFPSIFVDLFNQANSTKESIEHDKTRSEMNDLNDSAQNQKVPQ